MHTLLHYLRLRASLLLSFICVLGLVVLIAELCVHYVLTRELPGVALQSLQQRATRLAQTLERAGAQGKPIALASLGTDLDLPIRLYDHTGRLVEVNRPFPVSVTLAPQVIATRRTEARIITVDTTTSYSVLAVPLQHAGSLIGVLELAEPLPPIAFLRDSIISKLGMIAAVGLAALLGFWFQVGIHLSRRLQAIRRQTEAIVQGDLEARIHDPYRDEIGEIAGYLNRMAEDLQRLAKMRNEFLSKVSHELRTPLTIAIGFARLIEEDKLPPEQQRYVQTVTGQLDDLRRLVDDLLDLSRRQHGRLELRPELLSGIALLREAADRFRSAARAQRLALELALPADDITIYGDRQRLLQVLSNLIGNALRYAQRRIHLQLTHSGQQVEMRVSDDGPGIAPEDQAHIFEPFFQAQRGRRGRAGLGLTIARELVLAHDGTLELESGAQQGTTFVIRLQLPSAALHPASDECRPVPSGRVLDAVS